MGGFREEGEGVALRGPVWGGAVSAPPSWSRFPCPVRAAPSGVGADPRARGPPVTARECPEIRSFILKRPKPWPVAEWLECRPED